MLFVSLVIVDTSIQRLSSFVDTLATNFHLLDRKCVRERIRVKKRWWKLGLSSREPFHSETLPSTGSPHHSMYALKLIQARNAYHQITILYGNFDVIMARTIWRSLDSALTIKLKYQAIIWPYYENVGKLNGYDRAQAQLILTFVCASLRSFDFLLVRN